MVSVGEIATHGNTGRRKFGSTLRGSQTRAGDQLGAVGALASTHSEIVRLRAWEVVMGIADYIISPSLPAPRDSGSRIRNHPRWTSIDTPNQPQEPCSVPLLHPSSLNSTLVTLSETQQRRFNPSHSFETKQLHTHFATLCDSFASHIHLSNTTLVINLQQKVTRASSLAHHRHQTKPRISHLNTTTPNFQPPTNPKSIHFPIGVPAFQRPSSRIPSAFQEPTQSRSSHPSRDTLDQPQPQPQQCARSSTSS